jgi:hypothetical protein
MPSFGNAQGLVLPPPVGGLNLTDSLIGMSNLQSPWLKNVDCEGQYVSVRSGMYAYAQKLTGDSTRGLAAYTGSGTPKLFGYVSSPSGISGIEDFTGGGFSTNVVSINPTGPLSSARISSVEFNKYLFFFCEVQSENRRYSGTTWSTHAYTYTTITSPIGGTPFKGRLYIIDSATLVYEYTAVAAISGATTAVDLSSIFSVGRHLSFATEFSISDGTLNENYIAFGNNAGEVLVYGGLNPADASWALKGKFRIGIPRGYNNVIKHNGDALVLTGSGLVSLKQLFLQGSQAARNLTVSSPVDPLIKQLWANQLKSGNNYENLTTGVYYPDKNKIIIADNGYVNESGVWSASGCTFLVYDTVTLAWSVYTSHKIYPHISNLTYHNGQVYFAINRNFGGTGTNNGASVFRMYSDFYADGDSQNPTAAVEAYSFDIRGAWAPMGNPVATKKVGGFEAILKTDFNNAPASFGMSLNIDLGRKMTAQSKVVPKTGVDKLFYSVGGDGSFFQYCLSGTTRTAATEGLKLYSVNTVFEPGGLR